ncbi:MAG: dihydropyrimidinase [Candidatus Ornithospirochaeta sp.]
MASLLIKNGLVVDTEWTRHSDILVEGSRIKRIARNIAVEDCPEDVHVVDASGLCVLPGIIDAHTHYHLVSRGTVTADSFLEGSKLASYGGVTTVVDFADDNKSSLLSSTKDRLKKMREMSIDYALHQGVYQYRDSLRAELNQAKNAGIGAIKIFTTYRNVGYLVEKRDELKEIFSICKELGLLVCVHAEDDETVTTISENWKGQYRPQDHADLRPSEAEAKAIKYVGEIAGELDMPVYIVHLSSKLGLETVRELREKGIKVIAETTPHYLFLDRSKLEGPDGPLYVMTPPLRTKEDNEALQEALVDGEIQVVATDHCAFTRAQKLESNDCRTIYPGIPGTEELLPLVYNFGHVSGQLSMGQIVNLLSTGPAKAFGLYPKKGVLAEGSDADIVLFDPSEIWTISESTTHSESHYTPYEGMTVMGRVKMTYLRGRLVMGHDIYLGLEGDGQFVKAKRD